MPIFCTIIFVKYKAIADTQKLYEETKHTFDVGCDCPCGRLC